MKVERYYQCLIGRDTTRQTAWLPERGAKVGAIVELLPSHETWCVIEVYDLALPEQMLKQHQDLNRHSLPSVDPIR